SRPTIESLVEEHKDAADPISEAVNAGDGVDALRAWARRLYQGRSLRRFRWPHLVIMMGDQIYADSLSNRMKKRIKPSRERLRQQLRQQGMELSDDEFSDLSGQLLSFEEYRAAYIESWGNPDVRWALSCIPSLMVFDDHEVIDDWNLSRPWLNEKQRQPWWASQFVGALSAYWLYQGAGNLAPRAWRTDPRMRVFRPSSVTSSRSGTALLRSQFLQVAAGGRRQRFGYTFDVGATRIVVADCRTRRILNPNNRRLMDDEEWRWFEKQCTGSRHPFLIIVVTIPAFLPSLIHSLWGVVEGVSNSPTALALAGEWARQKVDVEHWAAFPASFDALAKLLRQLTGEGGRPAKRTVLLVSGDVHFSYNMEVSTPMLRSGSRVLQLVSSPARKGLSGGDAGVIQAMQSLSSAPASQSGVTWRPLVTPNGWLWFGNFIATLKLGHAGVSVEYDRAAVTQVRRDVNGRVQTTTETRLVPVARFRR
ncbi:MAG: alkaline phosphatase family protein, partial [Gammaproteobacteria bacterium]|nr:alkaline phosphatase family protein [Gammaproteobacteria bacterium]